jgi:hypothetical protein
MDYQSLEKKAINAKKPDSMKLQTTIKENPETSLNIIMSTAW